MAPDDRSAYWYEPCCILISSSNTVISSKCCSPYLPPPLHSMPSQYSPSLCVISSLDNHCNCPTSSSIATEDRSSLRFHVRSNSNLYSSSEDKKAIDNDDSLNNCGVIKYGLFKHASSVLGKLSHNYIKSCDNRRPCIIPIVISNAQNMEHQCWQNPKLALRTTPTTLTIHGIH